MGERGGACFVAGADKRNFQFSRWSQGCIKLPKVELVSTFLHS